MQERFREVLMTELLKNPAHFAHFPMYLGKLQLTNRGSVLCSKTRAKGEDTRVRHLVWELRYRAPCERVCSSNAYLKDTAFIVTFVFAFQLLDYVCE